MGEMMGILYIVGTPIGNMNDITFRALDVFKSVDLILVEDTRQTIKILNRYEIKKPMVSYHKFNEKERIKSIIKRLLSGENIALVSDAGTPCVSDPGYILVKEARDNKIEVIGIPGASALVTGLSISGLDSKRFSFIGFLPVNNKERKEVIEEVHHSKINTYIFYESPKRIIKLIKYFKDEFKDAKVAICSDLTKKFERVIYGQIVDVYNQIIDDDKIEKGEYTVILEKDSIKEKEDETSLSLEALIIDYMVKEKVQVKEAIKGILEKNKSIKKNALYEASLNLKKLM